MNTTKTPLLNTENLKTYSLFLKQVNKFLDALFVDELIKNIDTHKGADKSCVDRWLRKAFEFPFNMYLYNCADTYNFTFYTSILEKI